MNNQVPQEEWDNNIWKLLKELEAEGLISFRGIFYPNIRIRVEALLSQAREQGRREGLEEIVRELEGMKKKPDSSTYLYHQGQSLALDQAISLIKAKLESK